MKKELPEKILMYLEKVEWPCTSEDVAKAVDASWHTTQTTLLKLALENKVKYRKVGRQNQWWLVRKYNKEFEKSE